MPVVLDYMEYANNNNAQEAYVTSDGYGSDVCTGGIITESSYYSAYDGAMAFDNILDSNHFWGCDGATGWLKYDFGEGNEKTIQKYTIVAIYSNLYPDRAPKNWTLEGSNNDSDWDVLDTVTNETSWTEFEKREFIFSNAIAYRYYKLVISVNNGNGSYMMLTEMEMIEINLQCYSESTIKEQGDYSLKGLAIITDSLNDTFTRTVNPTVDLTDQTQIKYDIRGSRTGSHIKIGIHDSGGITSEHTANIVSANTWQTETWDISGVSNANKDRIDSIIITIVNADTENTFYIDNMYAISFMLKQLSEAFSAVDSWVARIKLAEAFSVADNFIKNVTKSLSESFSIADSLIKNVIKALGESLSIADSVIKSITKNVSEAFSVVDSLVKNAIKQSAETWSLADSLVTSGILYLSESLSIIDSFKRFFYNLYSKVSKSLSIYTKRSKDTSTYTKIDKSGSDYTKKDKEKGEE